MTQEDAFLQDILEHQEDDTPRRIFADWLLDHDDPVIAARGELIHVQCDLARAAAETPRPAALVRREEQLLEAHAREWGALFQRLGCTCWEYRRGFVEGVGISASAFLAQAPNLFASAPIRSLKLYQSGSVVRELALCPYLARVHTLDLENNQLGDPHLEVLSASPHLARVENLLLWANQIGDAGLRALAAAAVPRLARLDLSGNSIGDAGVEHLAVSPLMKQLTMLDLTGNQIGDNGAVVLAASPHTSGLKWLELAKNPITATGLGVLRERFANRVHVWG